MQASWLPLLIQSKHCLYQTLLRGCQLVALQRNTWQDEMRFMPYFTLALHAWVKACIQWFDVHTVAFNKPNMQCFTCWSTFCCHNGNIWAAVLGKRGLEFGSRAAWIELCLHKALSVFGGCNRCPRAEHSPPWPKQRYKQKAQQGAKHGKALGQRSWSQLKPWRPQVVCADHVEPGTKESPAFVSDAYRSLLMYIELLLWNSAARLAVLEMHCLRCKGCASWAFGRFQVKGRDSGNGLWRLKQSLLGRSQTFFRLPDWSFDM